TTPAIGAAALAAPAHWPSARTKALLDLFGLRVPIFQAGFGTVTSVALAAAVSNAGAMGALGTVSARTARQRVTDLRAATKRPFLTNMVLHLFPTTPPDVLQICPDAGAPVIQFSWGLPSHETVAMIHAAHAKCGVQVGSKDGARQALDTGA